MRFALIAAAAALALGCAASEPAKDGAPTGGMCGGIVGFQCGSPDDYCSMPAGECVAVADAAGVCKKKPEICTMEYAPVCGCDGRTYPSACAAAGKGVSVASQGECES